jgi:FkbM family methyltransferase
MSLAPGRVRTVGREVLQLIRPPRTVTIAGQPFRITGASRFDHDDRDYAVLRELARGCWRIFDVGGYVGVTALLMARASGGEVWTFDASDTACRTIEANAALNGLARRIHPVQAVVAARSGQLVDFYSELDLAGSASTVSGYLGHHRRVRKVSLSLDDFVQQTELQPDLVKIDVEGGERDVIDGMASILQTSRPLLLVEVHSWEGVTLPENVGTLLPLLEAVGYQMVFLETRQRVRDPAVMAHRGRCHVLVLPEDRSIPPAIETLDTSAL